MRMPPLIACLGFVLGAAMLQSACSESPSGPAAQPRADVLVVTERARFRSIRDQVEAIATARANESVTITAKVTDTVSRVHFDDGQLVDAGDVLLELSNLEETALLAEAEANVGDLRRQLERLEDLLEQRTVPVSQVDEARARFAGAEARYQSVVARLADRQIRAPFTGLLGFRQVSEGTLITPGTAITTLDDVSTIKLDFSLPEVYLSLLHPGLSLAAQSVAYPDQTFEATVRTIDSRVDPVTRAATVRAVIDNPNLLLRPGMLLTVELVTAERQALMVPEDALVQRGDQAYVFIVEDDIANIRPVVHGTRFQGWVEITGGLSPGDSVITEGVIKVRPGLRITRAAAAGAHRPAGGDPGL